MADYFWRDACGLAAPSATALVTLLRRRNEDAREADTPLRRGIRRIGAPAAPISLRRQRGAPITMLPLQASRRVVSAPGQMGLRL